MQTDKIPEDRLFQHNTKEEVKHWCQNLQYFHYMRGRGGHNCEGDSFSVYFKYTEREDLIARMQQLGVAMKTLEKGFIAFDPFESYSFDDLDKLKITIPQFGDLEQPQYVEIFGSKVHIWVMGSQFEISVSGTKDGQTYKVSDEDFEVCQILEKEFDKLGWRPILDDEIKKQRHCISTENYPELYIK